MKALLLVLALAAQAPAALEVRFRAALQCAPEAGFDWQRLVCLPVSK